MGVFKIKDAEGNWQVQKIIIQGDAELSDTSTNAIQNKVVKAAIDAEVSRATSKETELNNKIDAIDLTNYVTKATTELENYYLKSETYTQEEVNNLIGAIKSLDIIVVDELPEASEDTLGAIYLVPSSSAKEQNIKDEYITVHEDTTYKWELIGSTAIDLSNYYTKTETDSLLNSKQDTLTAGENITIEGNVISADDSFVVNFTYASNKKFGSDESFDINSDKSANEIITAYKENKNIIGIFALDEEYSYIFKLDNICEEENRQYVDFSSVLEGVCILIAEIEDRDGVTTGIAYEKYIGREQVQSDWDEEDTLSPAYIQNKPFIPEGIVVDTEMSSTSINPVQNKIITQYLEPVLGELPNPSSETINYVTSTGEEPPMQNWAEQGYRHVLVFAYNEYNNNPCYIEAGFDITEGGEDAYDLFDIGLCWGYSRSYRLPAFTLKSKDGNSHIIHIHTKGYAYSQSGSRCGNAYIGTNDRDITVRGTWYEEYANTLLISHDFCSNWNVSSNDPKMCYLPSISTVPITEIFYPTLSGSNLGTVTYWDKNFTFNGKIATRPWNKVLENIENLKINKQDKLTAGTNITIDENNVISASGGEQVQVDWNQTDDTAVDFIKNKPEIPTPITVDTALSTTSENPVQNKVIEKYLEPILGIAPNPSETPANFVFNSLPPFHTVGTHEKLIQGFLYDSSTSKNLYVEIIVSLNDTTSDFPSNLTPTMFKYANSPYSNRLGFGFYNENAAYNLVGTYSYYVYSDTGILNNSETGNAINMSISGYTGVTMTIRTTGSTIITPTKISMPQGIVATSTQSGAYKNVDILIYTINGILPTPWETIQTKVQALETSTQPKLTAGENITIDSNNVISATGTPSWTLLQTVTGNTPITLPEDYSEIYFEVQDTSEPDNIGVYWCNTLYKDMIGNIQKTYGNCCQYAQVSTTPIWVQGSVKTTSNSINLEDMVTPYGDISSEATFVVWYR